MYYRDGKEVGDVYSNRTKNKFPGSFEGFGVIDLFACSEGDS